MTAAGETIMTRVIIDAGHGGNARAGNSSAVGARGASGTLEKDVTLDIARHVVARLGAVASLTRGSDVNLSLGSRAQRAVRDGAEVFVSIHANSGPPGAAGPETYVHPSGAPASRVLAAGIQRALDRMHGRLGAATQPREGVMAVLSPSCVGARTAACLAEVDYLSNPTGEQRLRDPRHRAAVGAAIADAIREHLGRAPARAMADESFDVRYVVGLIPQPTGMSCWAASAAMLVSWREQMSRVDAAEIARGAGHWAEYQSGLNPADVGDLASCWGLTAEAPQSYTVEGLRQLLETRGPLWIGEAVPSLHAIVIAGIAGDGTPDGTRVRIVDPWPPGTGAEYEWTFRRMMTAYEAAASFPSVNIQILHNGGRGPVGRLGPVAQAAGLFDDIVDSITDAVDPIANVFHRAVDTNKVVATAFTPPARYYDKVRAYAAANTADGVWLTMGLARDPRFWQGGWILDIQTGASAMTLDRDVFFRDSLSIGTFAHELVHVGQYAILGPTDFLVSYFGLSAATIAWRFVRGEPLEVMRSSPHENQAYEIGRRFEAWLAANP
ncbi:MAG TPA: papain-like cysteine protease family protein [Kofleriaceae bacterium]|nr:papain-like cysteine protease family protein [Kofleriaceae bacterium]